ncbi:hypothetical protein ABFT23_18960 [Nocardioides sp. C4-1]|uniref:hypothetical protein n=1 Tax=Nocardioides sp. C4-1 TaxID=3151851 RepID=UPI003266C0F9
MAWDYSALRAKAEHLYETAVEVETEKNVRDGANASQMPATDSDYESAAAGVREKYADVPSMFSDYFLIPEGDGWDDAIRGCELAMFAVSADAFSDPAGQYDPATNPNLAALNSSARYINEWDGLAANAFLDNHVLPFRLRMKNIHTAIAVLKGSLEALRDVWSEVPQNLDNIVTQAQHAMENCYECNADDWNMAIKVLSLAATVAVPFVGVAGTLTAAGITTAEAFEKGTEVADKAVGTVDAIASAGSGIGEAMGSDPDSQGDEADTPEDVIREAKQAVTTMQERIVQVEKGVETAMTNALAMLQDFRTDFIPEPPSLADADENPRFIGRPDDNDSQVSWV